MNRLKNTTLCTVMVGALGIMADPVAVAADKHDGRRPHDASLTDVKVQVWFPPQDVTVIREYYEPRHRSLPPGLQKKYKRTGKLPPGWQKKFQPLPAKLERRLIVLPPDYRRGVIDGHAVIFNRRTQVIVDLAVLF
jgi:hypothetical protein